MKASIERPIPIEKHPLTLQKYIIATPSIDEFYGRVRRCIRLRTPGAIIFSHPRFGKTYATRYISNVLREDFGKVPVYSFLCHKKGKHSESAFFSNLLVAVNHDTPQTGTIAAKRSRLINKIKERVDASLQNLVVFFADEAQRLSVIEYEWLRDVHDELDNRGIRMVTFLVGQHELINQKNALREAKQTQIVARFMIDEVQFRGLLSVDDMVTCLDGYDTSVYPHKSDWSFTRFFYPQAHASGFRLSNQARFIWDAFVEAHEEARLGFRVEIPMQYFARAVEIAISENMQHDAYSMKWNQKTWRDAVTATNYVQAQEEMRLVFAEEDN